MLLVLNCASILANQTDGDFVQNSGSLTLVALTCDESWSLVIDIFAVFSVGGCHLKDCFKLLQLG